MNLALAIPLGIAGTVLLGVGSVYAFTPPPPPPPPGKKAKTGLSAFLSRANMLAGSASSTFGKDAPTALSSATAGATGLGALGGGVGGAIGAVVGLMFEGVGAPIGGAAGGVIGTVAGAGAGAALGGGPVVAQSGVGFLTSNRLCG